VADPVRGGIDQAWHANYLAEKSGPLTSANAASSSPFRPCRHQPCSYVGAAPGSDHECTGPFARPIPRR